QIDGGLPTSTGTIPNQRVSRRECGQIIEHRGGMTRTEVGVAFCDFGKVIMKRLAHGMSSWLFFIHAIYSARAAEPKIALKDQAEWSQGLAECAGRADATDN